MEALEGVISGVFKTESGGEFSVRNLSDVELNRLRYSDSNVGFVYDLYRNGMPPGLEGLMSGPDARFGSIFCDSPNPANYAFSISAIRKLRAAGIETESQAPGAAINLLRIVTAIVSKSNSRAAYEFEAMSGTTIRKTRILIAPITMPGFATTAMCVLACEHFEINAAENDADRQSRT